MKIIGITGGVGSGKSEVMKYLETHYDCTLIRSDELAHELMKKGQVCYDPILALLGPGVLGPDREFDRKAVAAKIFADKKLLEQMNRITHPAVRKSIALAMKEAADTGRSFFFLEAALLIEEKYDEICDELWYVYADAEVRKQRLRKSRGYSDEKIRQIMANQLPDAVFRKLCAFVLDNSGAFTETIRQIDSRMQIYPPQANVCSSSKITGHQ
ncbi:MAG: dephospho-CoA kinase [Bilifractor sp.]|nr:dephospho-CoA kinase [Lachnospiraceae bacterium]MDY2837780.1 dephospho-CoA kinase [Bilifractor sp.]